jgi:phage protein D
MSGISPVDAATSLITFSIKVNGLPIKSYYQVISIDVERDIDKLDYARFTIADGSAEEAIFSISDSTDFVPGNKIIISTGYDADPITEIFAGVVTAKALTIQGDAMSYITVICKGEKPAISASDLDAPPLLTVTYGESILSFDAELKAENNSSFVKGDVSFAGNASVKPGLTIELAGVGNRFSGIQYIVGTKHKVADGNWITFVTFDSRRPQW